MHRITFTTALALARHGFVLDSGRIVLSGSAESLSSNSMVQEAYLGVAAALS